jgi:hypothetical protein
LHKINLYLGALLLSLIACNNPKSGTADKSGKPGANDSSVSSKSLVLDTVLYKKITSNISNNDTTGRWPVVLPYPFPLPGSVLPFHRIVAFYGNLYSKKMGILGELPREEMLQKLKGELAKWQAADSSLPVLPALHYVAITAQGMPGKDNKFRYRMPLAQIDTVMQYAKEINALTFVDIQVGHSTVKEEVPTLEKYLAMPTVHLGIDPEFSMKFGDKPGKRIGTFNAEDINAAIDYLQMVVKKYKLTPKILVVHRFTQGMVTGYAAIKRVPEVQVVMDMDGWGDKILKRSTYLRYIYKEPVQYTGFKLFYKNDTKTGADQMYTPAELLKFTPKPVYIQYQ